MLQRRSNPTMPNPPKSSLPTSSTTCAPQRASATSYAPASRPDASQAVQAAVSSSEAAFLFWIDGDCYRPNTWDEFRALKESKVGWQRSRKEAAREASKHLQHLTVATRRSGLALAYGSVGPTGAPSYSDHRSMITGHTSQRLLYAHVLAVIANVVL